MHSKREMIEKILAAYPVFQYGFLDVGEIEFKEEVQEDMMQCT